MSVFYVHLHTTHAQVSRPDEWFRELSQAEAQSHAQRRVAALQAEFRTLHGAEIEPPEYAIAVYDELDLDFRPVGLLATMPALMFAKLMTNMVEGQTGESGTLMSHSANYRARLRAGMANS